MNKKLIYQQSISLHSVYTICLKAAEYYDTYRKHLFEILVSVLYFILLSAYPKLCEYNKILKFFFC